MLGSVAVLAAEVSACEDMNKLSLLDTVNETSVLEVAMNIGSVWVTASGGS